MPFGQPTSRRGRGLVPLSGADWATVHAVGLSEEDVRSLGDLLQSAHGFSKKTLLLVICCLLVRRGIKKTPAVAVSPKDRSRSATSPKPDGASPVPTPPA